MTFEWPTVLLALGLLPILLGFYIVAQRRRKAYAVRFTNLALLREVAGPGPGIRRHIPPALFLLGLAALLVSLARPHAVIAVPQDQTAIMLVMDVSGSMDANDLQPSRLAAAKTAAQAFLKAVPDNAQVGLVAFSSTASVRTPLTKDTAMVDRTIRSLTIGGGTAIGDGLQLALTVLAQRPPDEDGGSPPGLVVLLSDGQQSDGFTLPEEAAAQAQADGVTVHTVGIGQRGAAPRVLGGRAPARLDETTLQRIADTTGGQYYYAAETQQLEDIYQDLGSKISWVEQRTEVTALVTALGTAVTAIGGLLSLLWFQRFP